MLTLPRVSKLIKTKKDIELLVEKHHIEILEERLNEKDKAIERLNNITKNALEYIPNFRNIIQSHEPGLTCLKVLEDILKGRK